MQTVTTTQCRMPWMRSTGLRRLASALALALLLTLLSVTAALGSGITNSADDLRDGWYPEQASLTPQLVSGGTFGKLWSTSVEGSVYAQPLLENGTLLVATEANKVYGLDPATGASRWPAPVSLGTPWKAADIGCGDLTPTIGVTATPVIDPVANIAYMTHKTYASGSSGTARWYMDAIEMSNGKEKAGFPVALGGSAQNQPGQTFAPTTELQRPGLLLMEGVVYAAFGSSCDTPPWQGWVFGVSTAGQVKARWVSIASSSGAGIWQSGAGLNSDGPGTLMVSTGNGGAPTGPIPGKSPPASLGESIVRLAVQGDGSLKPVDFFAPFDARQLDSWDADFASGGITGLNDKYFGTASVPHLAVAVGKNGYVYLLNRESLGGIGEGSGGSDNVVQRIGPYGGVWARPGVWPGDGGWVYIPTASGGTTGNGTSGFLRVYQYGVSGTGKPTLSLQATSSDAFGFSSGAPVITSNGTASGSALMWTEWAPNGTGSGAQLRAYDPIPVGGKPVLRWSAPIGTSSKFATPGVGAGRLYVGTRDGKVLGFGSPVTAALSGPSTSFPVTSIGSSSEKTLTLTATKSLTLSKLTSSSSQFTIGTPSIPLPASLTAGQSIQVPLTFTPSQTGLVGGSLSAETNLESVSFAMSGTGQAANAQLTSTPAVVSFGGTTVGGQLAGAATFRNVGGAALTINAIKLPAAPFAASGLPAIGSTIPAGGSITVNLSFEPTQEGNFNGEIAMETTGGNAAVGLVGSAGTAGTLKISSESNEYGPVQVGASATRSFTVTNTGGTTVTVTKSKPPSGAAFAASTSLAEGTTIAPGETVTENVVFTPTAPGYTSAAWTINGDDSSGLHEVSFKGTGTVPAPGSAWSHNGAASIASGVLQTTPASTNVAGSSFFATPLDSRHLSVEFDQTINSGTGADGQTVTFADASKATPASVGYHGGGLGFSGIPGIAVAFDTYKNSVNPSANFVGVTDGPGSAADLMHWLFTASPAANLRSGTHRVKVEVLSGAITVWIDGTQVLNGTATLPARVLLGFTGGTGGLTDVHQVANVLVTGDPAPSGGQPASLKIATSVLAPAGSSQAATKLAYSGSCPSAFTTSALGNGESATPTLTGAVAGASCSVSQAAPSGSGWKTTASVNGGPAVELTPSGGQLAVPAFALAAGANTVAVTNTYTSEPQPASLKLTSVVNAPTGSPQAATKLAFSGSCPSSFTTAALGNGESATPTLTGAVAGASCSVSQAAPSGSGWKTTASVNGGPAVELTPSGGQLAVATFALAAGVNSVTLTSTYTESGGSLIPDPSAGGWQLNGSAALEAPSLVLTGVATNEAGSAFWPTQLGAQNRTIEFELSIGGGTGADGLALVFADASKGATPTSLGESGGGLGFGGIPGIALAFDTYKGGAAANYVGVSDGKGTEAKTLHWLGTANVTPTLRATHKIKVSTAGGAIVLWIDGTKVGSLSVALPTKAYIGFSAGTGGFDDRHAIAHLSVS
jgi:lectin family protein/ASPM-SPD-2-Hydin domain-containing protein/HYDIN/CFA65/VesB family protein/putative pyrroloquinoline-quinone-binding quinoprotein